MFNLNADSKIRGPGFVVLNALRVLNVISLLLVAIASWVMLVMTVKTSNFFFFDGVSHFVTASISLFLIVSEVSLFKSYFAKCWPLLSNESGLVFLGLSMIALGFNILGNLNKAATSVQSLGLPLWRVVIASGILSSLAGLFNIIATCVFCNRRLGITGRQVRSHGAAIPESKESVGKTFSLNSGSIRRAPSTILPTYNTTSDERRKSRFPFKFPIQISKPIPNDPNQFSKWEGDRSSPVAPDVQRPATALHPINRQEPAPSYPRSSRYSEVSDMTRF